MSEEQKNSTVPRSIFFITLLAGLFAIGYLIGSGVLAKQAEPPALDEGTVVDPPLPVEDFTMTSHTGEALSLSDLQGRAVLMFFGYTNCPDVCPTTLADYTRVKTALGDAANDVEFVFISVDPRRDTPDVLAEYLGGYDPAFIGLVGDEATLERIGPQYGLDFSQQSIDTDHQHEDSTDQHNTQDEDYLVEHTTPSYLIDPQGRLRWLFSYGTEPEAIAEGIKQILQ